ncbi:DUF5329 domain-containing protein [Marinomonas primoryensis]|uniref:DUF5329 domain-containing protein n=1 Tax=Marinomonas primoryensis TaxID=178399 RepID=UPI0030DC38F8
MKKKTLFFMLMTFFTINLFASTQDEISHLLDYVGITECKYERNGTLYNGAEAVNHINKKYDYYRNKVQTAEDFIEYAATKSVFSGKYYLIHCNDNPPVKSQDWLSAELVRYRDTQK